MNTNKKLFRLGLMLIVFCGLGIFVIRNWEEIIEIRIENPIVIIPIISLTILTLIVNGHFNNLMMAKFGAILKFYEWFGLSIITAMGNYVSAMRGGSLANAVYLKKKHKFSYAKFIIFNAGLSLINLIIICFWLLVILSFKKIEGNSYLDMFFLIFLTMFIFLMILISLNKKVSFKSKKKFWNLAEQAINGWQKIRSDQKLVRRIFFWLMVNILMIITRDWLTFYLIGDKLEFTRVAFLTIFTSISGIISLTPGGLGIKESFNLISASLVNISLERVLVVSFIERFISIIIVIGLGTYYSKKLMMNISKEN